MSMVRPSSNGQAIWYHEFGLLRRYGHGLVGGSQGLDKRPYNRVAPPSVELLKSITEELRNRLAGGWPKADYRQGRVSH